MSDQYAAIRNHIDQQRITEAAEYVASQLKQTGVGATSFTEGAQSLYRVAVVDQDMHPGCDGKATYFGARYMMATDMGPMYPIPDRGPTHVDYVRQKWCKFEFGAVVFADFIAALRVALDA